MAPHRPVEGRISTRSDEGGRLDKWDMIVIGAAIGFAVPLLVGLIVITTVYFTSEPDVIVASPTSVVVATTSSPGAVTGTTAAPDTTVAPDTTAAPVTTAGPGATVPPTTVPAADPGLDGAQVAVSFACTACHSSDGSAGVGPTWQGLFGSERPLEDGSTVIADGAYILESIIDPTAKIAQGFPPAMPPDFGDRLSEDEINALITYIQSLS